MMGLFPKHTGDFWVEKADLANLDMLELAQFFSPTFKDRQEIFAFLNRNLSADEAELKKRQAVLQALRTVTGIEEKLERLIQSAQMLIQKTRGLRAERSTSLLTYCNTGKAALIRYLTLTKEYQALLTDCPDPELQSEKLAMGRLFQSDCFQVAHMALEKIEEVHIEFHSIDIGCNVNEHGEVTDFGIIGFNLDQGPLTSLLRGESGKLPCLSDHIPYGRLGPLAEA